MKIRYPLFFLSAFGLGVISTILLGESSFFQTKKGLVAGEVERTLRHPQSSLSSSKEITCTYPQILNAMYFEGEVTHILPKPETTAFIFTFSDLEGDTPKLKYLDSTKTISEVSLLKVSDSGDKLVFIEGSDNSYIATHTIYKKDGVAIYSKEADLIGIPSGSLAMGTCVGY